MSKSVKTWTAVAVLGVSYLFFGPIGFLIIGIILLAVK